ncbi:MAG: MotA/TolQ/ExbB proton channel family protein [Bacteroidota bacterium]
MNEITKLLYWISTGLLIPVIVLLLFFFIRSLLLIGAFYGMYMNKLRFNKKFKGILDNLTAANISDQMQSLPQKSTLLIATFLNRIMHAIPEKVYYDKALNDYEIACQKDLSGSQTLAKLGPVLGLMGTLIPMGPALVGLAAGDIESMAMNMQVAFSTTVIGLFTGAVGFIILQIKKRWYAADLNNLEFVSELLKKSMDAKEAEKEEQMA